MNNSEILFFLIVSYKDFSIKLVHSKRINKLVYCFYDTSATGDRHLGQHLQSRSLLPPQHGGDRTALLSWGGVWV